VGIFKLVISFKKCSMYYIYSVLILGFVKLDKLLNLLFAK